VLDSSFNNVLSGNNVTANNVIGTYLVSSSNNTLSGNNVANNWYGIWLVSASSNSIFHNNLQQVYTPNSSNVWDDGYPSGGNYWSDYTGVDVKSARAFACLYKHKQVFEWVCYETIKEPLVNVESFSQL